MSHSNVSFPLNTPTLTNKVLSIVIPAYDELENLKWLLPQIHSVLRDFDLLRYEIIVVLPAGPFGNEPIDEELQIRGLGATVIRRRPGNSFGDALRTGFELVDDQVDYVVTLDADGSHRPSTIVSLLENAQNASVVVASRYIDGGSSENGAILRFMSKTLNVVFSVVLGVKCRDVSTNFKLYSAKTLKPLRLSCQNFDIIEEILLEIKLALGKDFRLVEVPDHFAARRSGISKRRLGPFIATYVLTLVRLRMRASLRANWRNVER
jgi:dolichol-phosphate mannosyltransferase